MRGIENRRVVQAGARMSLSIPESWGEEPRGQARYSRSRAPLCGEAGWHRGLHRPDGYSIGTFFMQKEELTCWTSH